VGKRQNCRTQLKILLFGILDEKHPFTIFPGKKFNQQIVFPVIFGKHHHASKVRVHQLAHI
jgi:hypothetical protein